MSSRNKINSLVLAVSTMAAMAPLSFGRTYTEPTPQEIATQWAVLGGGKDGFVAYNKGDSLMWLTLKTGEAHKLAKVAQASLGTSKDWGMASGLKISPDGKRIAAEGGPGVWVVGLDGS